MNKFFDKYRQKVEADKDIAFVPADWDQMEKKLNQRKNTLLPIPFFIWPLLTGLSIATLVYYRSLGREQSSTDKIEKPTSLYSQPITNTLRDTIIIEKYIEKTVYITKWVEKTKTDTVLIESPQHTLATNSEVLKLNNMIADQKHEIQRLQASQSIAHQMIDSPENQSSSNQNKQNLTPSSTENKPSAKDLEVPIAVSLPIAVDTLSSWQKFTQGFQPVGLDIHTLSGIPLAIHRNLTNRPGIYNGLRLNLLLKSGLELQAGLDYTKFLYSSAVMDARLGIPVKAGPANDFQFYQAEVKNTRSTIDFAMAYRMQRSSNVQPSLGIGFGYTIPFKSTVVYDFIKPGSSLESSETFEVGQTLRRPIHFLVSGSVKYQIGLRWYGTLNSSWQPFRNKNNIPAYSGVKIGGGLGFRLY